MCSSEKVAEVEEVDDEVTERCCDCRADLPIDRLHELSSGYFCDDCVLECEGCGEMIPCRESRTVYTSRCHRHEEVCEDCWDDCFTCSDCGKDITGDHTRVDSDDLVCDSCLEDAYYFCEECDEYHPNSFSCGRRGSAHLREHSNRPLLGTPTAEFGSRTVGVEIETGEGASCRDFSEELYSSHPSWGYKEDGSLNDGGMELVSPPMSGDRIPSAIRSVYSVLSNYGVDMRDGSAGCHVHVDYRDIRDRILQEDKHSKLDLSELFTDWGDKMTYVVRRMVSQGRADNSYCNGSFGIRNSCEVHWKMHDKVNVTGYASIAVRDKTLEFRIWDISEAPDRVIARAEFCQKAVELLAKITEARGKDLKKLRKRLDRACSAVRHGSFLQLSRLLRLTRACSECFEDIVAERAEEIAWEEF